MQFCQVMNSFFNLKITFYLILGVTANKSAGIVGKWGSASFTSLRAASATANSAQSSNGGAVSRPKKFFKSRQVEKEPEEEDGEPMG